MQCHIVDAFVPGPLCVVSYLVSQVSSPVRGPHFSDHLKIVLANLRTT